MQFYSVFTFGICTKNIVVFNGRNCDEKQPHLFKQLEERVFEKIPNFCEECNKPLNSEFRDDNGRVANRWQYSHILIKAMWNKQRRDINNCNRLCLKHHDQWEHGNKRSMGIWKENVKRCKKMGIDLDVIVK